MEKSVIWITGASSGIGEAAAKKFSNEGFQVIISARNTQALERVKSACSLPSEVFVLRLDLEEIDTFEDKVKEAIAHFGKVDILLHNGGISQRSLIRETPLDVDRKLMEVNFFGTIALTKAILPHFISRNSGHFAVISSLVGKFGSPFRSSYAASKHALHGFFDTLRAEHFQENITVTMICPGFIRTNVSMNALTADGTALGQMDEAQQKGMSPEACAEELFSAIIRKKEEVNIGGKETLAVLVKRFFPGIFSKIIKKAKVR
ncbi:SDR family oxidoreductase [Algoriphagus litoralis]|uniref:SDR family oxidoreductase n=1 Tax=Algoriphagus litoralis TaxID=2202829 RepID=UPI000DBA4678|nr:SDR family oxidoreductase [Algoriphagus litoralis]